jgi:hypothetical protein
MAVMDHTIGGDTIHVAEQDAAIVADLSEWTCRGMWSDEWQEIAMYRLWTLVRGLVTLVNKG